MANRTFTLKLEATVRFILKISEDEIRGEFPDWEDLTDEGVKRVLTEHFQGLMQDDWVGLLDQAENEVEIANESVLTKID